MQIVSCPSCGAEVKFRSHASVMAVCEYCGTSVLKDADAVRDLGKMSAVLEDYSPIQIGTSGVLGGRSFTVVGRIQLRYAAGLWNEWYLLFDDGGASWLGDSSGMYVVTSMTKLDGPLPAFGELAAGRQYQLGPYRMVAAEVRTADCIGGQGELPFKVGQGYQARVADFRRGGEFLTLDYSDGEQPVIYSGVAVTLEAMQCQLLREDDAIERSAGRYRGKLSALDCPSCGSAIKYLPGMTAHLICPACQAQVDAASPKAQVLAAGERVAAAPSTLELGAKAKLSGRVNTVIGMMRRQDDEGNQWTEYLLYGAKTGFTWLVESEEGWSRATVMEVWPEMNSPDMVSLDRANFDKLYEYGAQVVYAIGAFNWKVAVGDRNWVAEFARGQVRLAAEMTPQEMTWSRSSPVPFDQMKAWFGEAFRGVQRAAPSKGRFKRAARNAILVMLALNALPMLANFGRSWALTLLGALAIYLPAMFLDSKDGSS